MNLIDALPLLPASDRDFAQSLLTAQTKYGSLTPKQAYWADKLIARATRPAAQQVGDLSKVVGMFNTAATNLKRPNVRFANGGSEFIVSRAADTSANPGCLYVKREGEYLGKVTPSGEFRSSRDADTAGVLEALQAFAAAPEAVAKAYGQKFGCCCFCSRELTDDRSIHAGYGPVCAENYGLAWGGGDPPT
jgi:hypothetical protein